MLPLSPGSAWSRQVAVPAWSTACEEATSARHFRFRSGLRPHRPVRHGRAWDSQGHVGGSSALRAAVRLKLKPHPQGTGSRYRAERTGDPPRLPAATARLPFPAPRACSQKESGIAHSK